jgi:hypothetical protein
MSIVPFQAGRLALISLEKESLEKLLAAARLEAAEKEDLSSRSLRLLESQLQESRDKGNRAEVAALQTQLHSLEAARSNAEAEERERERLRQALENSLFEKERCRELIVDLTARVPRGTPSEEVAVQTERHGDEEGEGEDPLRASEALCRDLQERNIMLEEEAAALRRESESEREAARSVNRSEVDWAMVEEVLVTMKESSSLIQETRGSLRAVQLRAREERDTLTSQARLREEQLSLALSTQASLRYAFEERALEDEKAAEMRKQCLDLAAQKEEVARQLLLCEGRCEEYALLVATMEREALSLRTEVTALRKKEEALLDECEGTARCLRESEEAVGEISSWLEEARREAEELRGERDAVREEAEELRGERDAVREEAEELRGERDAVREEVQQLKERIEQLATLSAEMQSLHLRTREGLEKALEECEVRVREGLELWQKGEKEEEKESLQRELVAVSLQLRQERAERQALSAQLEEETALSAQWRRYVGREGDSLPASPEGEEGGGVQYGAERCHDVPERASVEGVPSFSPLARDAPVEEDKKPLEVGDHLTCASLSVTLTYSYSSFRS